MTRSNLSLAFIAHKKTKGIQKKARHSYSQTHLYSMRRRKEECARKNFKRVIYQINANPQDKHTDCLLSFLNSIVQDEASASINYIPSIENMISEQHIEETKYNIVDEDLESKVLSEGNHEISVLYVCLLERVLRHLQPYPMAQQHKQKVMKGTWNILIKYWKDNNYRCYAEVGQKVEWGLLELIDFNFNVSPKERYEAEEIINASHAHINY